MARPVYSEAQVEQERLRLCRMALALYRKNGYEAVTLRELGLAAGVSHAMPYRYFRSKDDLFFHVRAEVFRQLDTYVQARDVRSADPIVRLRGMVSALAEFGQSSPDDYRLIFSMRQAATAPGSPVSESRRRLGNHIISVCQLAIDAGQLAGDAATQAHLIWASMHGLISLHVSNLLVDGPDVNDLLPPMLDRLFPVAAESKKHRKSVAGVQGAPAKTGAGRARSNHEQLRKSKSR